MAERHVGVPWTAQEDHLLTQAVAQHGESDNWKLVALSVPGRSNKACRKRWLHSLSPSVKKTAWTAEEDRKLLELYSVYSAKWAQIAREIPGRTDDACSKRYREALDPALKKDQWTPEEDLRLTQLYQRLGGRWGQIGHELQRSGLGCRNRWRLLLRKKAHPNTELPSTTATTSQGQDDSQGQTEWSPQSSWADHEPISHQSSHISVVPHSEASISTPTNTYNWSQYDFEPDQSPNCYNTRFSPPVIGTDAIPTSNGHHAPLTLTFPLNDITAHEILSAPQITPTFRFSSSSLSAALSDPLPSKPLPLVNAPAFYTPPDTIHPLATFKSTYDSPILRGPSPILCDQVSYMSAHDSRETLEGNGVQSQIDLSHEKGRSPATSLLFSSFASPLESGDNAILQDQSDLQDSSYVPCKPEGLDAPLYQSGSSISPFAPSQDVADRHPDSNSSTPSSRLAALRLSPLSSPADMAFLVELPSTSPTPSSSTLYSPYQPISSSRIPRRRTELPRLDSALPATSDRSVKPYACGYDQCWPPDAMSSTSCFATSKELSDHSKDFHGSDPKCDKPFRCGLDGCSKSWRSINGLQYHLQISKSHFLRAISSRFSSNTQSPVKRTSAPARVTMAEPKKKRSYPCPRTNCFNEYRQLGGLRYHLMHGHPEDMPAQLEVVPPTLARKMDEKLREKAPDE